MDPLRVFAALGDETRLEVLNRLAESGPASASALAADMPVTRQAISKHLNALEEAGLVRRARHGREIRYRVESASLDDVARWATRVGSDWDTRLERLRDELT